MASSSPYFFILSLLIFFFSSTIEATETSFTLSLTHFQTNPSSKLSHLAFASLSRAKHLKNPHITPTPLSPHRYGGYSISLSFGTPPQTIPFIMDTGSDFVWFPCTHRYICRNCSATATTTKNPTAVPSFIPRQSASARVLGCLNPKCGLIHSNYNVQSLCQDCSPNSSGCRQECPPYLILYGSGSTGGIALVETLDLPGRKVDNFVVGCSLFSSHQPAGIAGFGRGPSSLPTQLGLSKFSYCLLSHRFDDSDQSSPMILDTSINDHSNVSYTPFVNNPVSSTGKHAFSVYYYVGLRKITIGKQKVKIPYKYLTPGTNGNGGTIVDSGSTFTFMTNNVFKLVVNSLIQQVKYKRAEHVERQTGLQPCFTISSDERLFLPEMRFHFKGGADMVLPLANYFSFAGNSDTVCLTMVTDQENGQAAGNGPAIILGNYQMQNFYTEFDLHKRRFGFRRQSCRQ